MSMVSIHCQIPQLDDIVKALGSHQTFPFTREAVRAATVDLVQKRWIQYASGVRVQFSGGNFRIVSRTGDYVRSIQNGLRFPDDMTGEVFSTCKHGAILESGQDARDMKPKLLASPKAKTSKTGKKYITIPFRQGIPGTQAVPAMPKDIYKQAKALACSRILSPLPTRTYSWKGRIQNNDTGKRSHIHPHPGAGYTWKSGKYESMVKMGQKRQTQYLTFRRIAENSDEKSWMRPMSKPKPIRQAVIEHTREQAQQMIVAGFQKDLATLGLGEDR